MSINVDSTTKTGSGGFSDSSVTFSFSSSQGDIRSAGGAMTYFYASYGSNTDHHVKSLEGYIDSVAIKSNEVEVSADLTGKMKDDSGHDASVTLTADAAVDQSLN